jgi:hypothetical protein
MLKKIVLFVLLLSFSANTFAHPLDISKSTMGIKGEEVNITTYFHSFEIDYLLKENGIEISSISQYYDHKEIIKKYISKSIIFKNNNKYCET